MEFEQLIGKIESLKKANLTGIIAHQELAPLQRPTFTKYNIPENARKAGVLVLFYPGENNQTYILLTQRANYKGVHSNQISFPGGKKDNEDLNLQETALRETEEEIGLKKESVTILKQLSTIYIPPSNFSVNPYIGILKNRPFFNINYEVEEIIEFPLSSLLDKKNMIIFNVSTSSNKNMDVPCFSYKKHKIWGATAMILNEVKELLKNI